MLKVISFGEALVDMLSNRVSENQSDEIEQFAKYPGGAPANVAAAVGKLGGNSYMAGKIGTDMFGVFMRQSLHEAGVNSDYLLNTDAANTALAFVSLDAEGERSFTFYRNPSADMLFTADEFEDHWFADAGIFHFCSNTLTASGIKEATLSGIDKAKAAGFLISFDVNLRSNLWPAGSDPAAPIWQALALADLVKLSQEEMNFLAASTSQDEVLQRLLDSGVSLVLLTDGGNPLRYFSTQNAGTVTPPRVSMVDSTAAGDAFIGGFIYQLAAMDCLPGDLNTLLNTPDRLEQALRFASHCGAYAVSHKGAFTSLPGIDDLQL
ncbi:carbohydrate kinase family protein [Amphritea sp.]|uniref:carbohydrate kinase family protein n=1 Tax=Amphritea sp. TaxID=1872502 RepID=UPI003D09745E